jgi:hypothetical protein
MADGAQAVAVLAERVLTGAGWIVFKFKKIDSAGMAA